MYLGHRIGVVVPAYNEERHIREVVETLPPVIDMAYVVDDGSSDETWEEVVGAIDGRPDCRVGSTNGGGDGESTRRLSDDETAPRDAGHLPLTDGSGDRRGRTDGTGSKATSRDSSGDGSVRATNGGDATDGDRPPIRGPGGDLVGGLMAIETSTGTSPSNGEPPQPSVAEGVPADHLADRLASVAAHVHDGDLPERVRVSVPEETTRPTIVAVRLAENRGRGAAVKTGYRLALTEGMDVVVVMDGDGQMDPDNLERLVHPIVTGRADYAKGNRLNSPRYWQGMSRFRLFGNVVLTGLTRAASGYWRLRDPQNGYTAISRETLAELPLEDLYDRYGFLNDILVKLHMVDARVADVAMAAVYGDEESGIRYSSFVPSLSVLLLLNFIERLYREGIDAGNYAVPAAYGLAALGGLGAPLLSVMALVGAPVPGSWPAVGLLLGVSVLGAAVAVKLDGGRSLHLQQRVPLYHGVEGGGG